jgi:hypothetical protein
MRRFVSIALASTLMLQVAPLMAAPATGGARAARQTPAGGIITGTAQSSSGQTLANQAVQARNLLTGQVAATSTSNGAGAFTFTGLSPANYVVEIVDSTGKILGATASVGVTAGTTATVTVAATAIAPAAAAVAAGAVAAGATTAGVSTALIVTTIAAAAGIAGVVVVVRNDASPTR